MNNPETMNQFLKEIESRAFRIAEIATSNREDALELVQEAMLKLAQKYSDKPTDEWPPLFHRILQSSIKDWYKRQSVRNRFRSWFGMDDETGNDPISTHPDRPALGPQAKTEARQFTEELELALKGLPMRQQQAFLLRAWEGFDVKQTAQAMNCSEGSVKTHYSRALATLRVSLEDFKQ